MVNLFANIGLVGTPMRRADTRGYSSLCSMTAGNSITIPAGTPEEVMDGEWLARTVNKNSEKLFAVVIGVQQPNEIIEFSSSKLLSKDLKRG